MISVDKNSIETKVKEILANRLGVKINNIKNTDSLKDNLGIDSFDSIELVFEIENSFNIDVPQKEILNINSVGDIINHILECINKMNK